MYSEHIQIRVCSGIRWVSHDCILLQSKHTFTIYPGIVWVSLEYTLYFQTTIRVYFRILKEYPRCGLVYSEYTLVCSAHPLNRLQYGLSIFQYLEYTVATWVRCILGSSTMESIPQANAGLKWQRLSRPLEQHGNCNCITQDAVELDVRCWILYTNVILTPDLELDVRFREVF